MPERINDARVDRMLTGLDECLRPAWQHSLPDVEAFVERLRVQMMVEELSKPRKAVNRAVIDYFEDVIEQRREKEGTDKQATRKSVIEYVKGLLDTLD